MTPAQLRRLAEEAEHSAGQLEQEAVALREQAGELRRLAERAEKVGLHTGLPHDTRERIIRPMDVNTHGMDEDVKRGAARATRKHPAQKRLYRKGVTITRLADELDEGRPRVSSWFAAKNPRPIPRRHAEYLREKYSIPLSDWVRIAD